MFFSPFKSNKIKNKTTKKEIKRNQREKPPVDGDMGF